MNRIESVDAHPFGLWCVELDGEPIGFTAWVPWFRGGVGVGLADPLQFWGHDRAPGAGPAAVRVRRRRASTR